jgi:hypothetical protein
MTTKIVVGAFALLASLQAALDLLGLPAPPPNHETRIEGPK